MRNRYYLNEQEDWWDDACDFVKDKARTVVKRGKEAVKYAKDHAGDIFDETNGVKGGLGGAITGAMAGSSLGPGGTIYGAYKGGKTGYKLGKYGSHAIRTGIKAGVDDFNKSHKKVNENRYIKRILREELEMALDSNANEKIDDATDGVAYMALDRCFLKAVAIASALIRKKNKSKSNEVKALAELAKYAGLGHEVLLEIMKMK